jgi:hypothetical protein
MLQNVDKKRILIDMRVTIYRREKKGTCVADFHYDGPALPPIAQIQRREDCAAKCDNWISRCTTIITRLRCTGLSP